VEAEGTEDSQGLMNSDSTISLDERSQAELNLLQELGKHKTHQIDALIYHKCLSWTVLLLPKCKGAEML
jgi:hypothetical protein